MGELTADDRTRLVKILGLLGSEHAGERDAAALRATELLTGRGLVWDDVLTAPMTGERLFAELARFTAEAKKQPRVVVVRATSARPQRQAGPKVKKPAAPRSAEDVKAARDAACWSNDLMFCMKHRPRLSTLEREFVGATFMMRGAKDHRRAMIVELATRLRASGVEDDTP